MVLKPTDQPSVREKLLMLSLELCGVRTLSCYSVPQWLFTYGEVGSECRIWHTVWWGQGKPRAFLLCGHLDRYAQQRLNCTLEVEQEFPKFAHSITLRSAVAINTDFVRDHSCKSVFHLSRRSELTLWPDFYEAAASESFKALEFCRPCHYWNLGETGRR